MGKPEAHRIRLKKGRTLVKRGKVWYLETFKDYRQFRITLATGDLAEAMRRVDEVRDTPLPRHGKLTIGQALEKYEAWYTEHNRESSKIRTMEILNAFADFVDLDSSIHALTREKVIAYRTKRSREVSAHTVNAEYARIRAFTNWLVTEGVLYQPVCVGVRRLPIPNSAKEAPDREKVHEFLLKFRGHPWLEDWLRLLAETGMRPQEALSIRGMDYENGVLKIRGWGEWKTKTGQNRSIELNENARQIVEGRTTKDKPVFANRKGERRDPHEAYQIMVRWLDKKKYAGSRLAPYDLRHFFCSQAAAAGWPIEKVAAYVGHASVSTLSRWYLDPKAQRRGMPPTLTATE